MVIIERLIRSSLSCCKTLQTPSTSGTGIRIILVSLGFSQKKKNYVSIGSHFMVGAHHMITRRKVCKNIRLDILNIAKHDAYSGHQ